MRKIEIISGGATNDNSIYFQTDENTVIAKLNKDENTFVLNEEKNKYINNKIFKIPVVNTIYKLFSCAIIKEQNKISINFLPCLLVVIYISDKVYFNMNLPEYSYLLYILLLSLVSKITNMSQLHGAEHMTYNYYSNHYNISIENIKDVKLENKSIYACGTTNYIIIGILLFLFETFIGDFMIKLILFNAISYYIINLSYKYKIVRKLFSPLFFISGLIQVPLFISKPKDVHLKMAISVINRLEQLENKLKE